MRNPSSQQAKQLTASILEYLALYEQYAVRLNDRSQARHFEECWRVVFETFYGRYALPRLPMPRRYAEPSIAPPAHKPAWQVNKYSRPVRKVVMQVSEEYKHPSARQAYTLLYDVLACGHKLDAAYKEDGGRTSKWRYCRECPPQTTAATRTGRLDSAAA